MTTVAFVVVAFMIGAYVLLDGYDLGVGAIAPFIARGDRERLTAMQSIGPFWNGNEVFLVAGGAVLFALFPRVYASSFSGFYLPFIVVLWLLMGRGIALELREHYTSDLWHQFWDACFTVASALLTFLFGVALGNLIRGVPLDAHGFFTGTFAFLLNWYALLVGLFAVVALAFHGAIFLILRTMGPFSQRARAFAARIWFVVLALFVTVTAATFVVHAPLTAWAYALGALGLAALIASRFALGRAAELQAFLTSSAFLGFLIAAAASTLYPYLIPAFPATIPRGISIDDGGPPGDALATALGVVVAGMAGVLIYGGIVWRMLAGKVRTGE
jgi:cytochrome bd ubiquinol oxidase subunit II